MLPVIASPRSFTPAEYGKGLLALCVCTPRLYRRYMALPSIPSVRVVVTELCPGI